MVTDKRTQLQLKVDAANAKLANLEAKLEAEQNDKEDQIEAIFGTMMSEITGVIDKAGISSRSRDTIEKSMVKARVATRKVLLEKDEEGGEGEEDEDDEEEEEEEDEEEEEEVKPKGKGKGKVSTNVAVVVTPKTPKVLKTPASKRGLDSQDDGDLQLVFPRNSAVSSQRKKAKIDTTDSPSVNKTKTKTNRKKAASKVVKEESDDDYQG